MFCRRYCLDLQQVNYRVKNNKSRPYHRVLPSARFDIGKMEHTKIKSVKAFLLLAIDELVRLNNCALYFPAYELMLDDLRDYRFYKEDIFTQTM